MIIFFLPYILYFPQTVETCETFFVWKENLRSGTQL